MRSRNTPRLRLSEATPKERPKVPAEYWTRINRQNPLQNKYFLIMDEIYGPMVATYKGDGEWKGNMCPDPCDVTHYIEFEYPR